MEEARLIDSNALMKEIEKVVRATREGLVRVDVIGLVLKAVMEAPAIKAEPVRHGRWIHDINNLYGCSECLKRDTMPRKRLKPYCPHCGARMEEFLKDGDEG